MVTGSPPQFECPAEPLPLGLRGWIVIHQVLGDDSSFGAAAFTQVRVGQLSLGAAQPGLAFGININFHELH